MDLERRMQSAELKIRYLHILCITQFVVLLGMAASLLLTCSVRAQKSPDVLHAHALIIEDTSGRPRILLGAPFPRVTGRKRQDEGSAAILFLDEKGADRLLIGEGIGAQIKGNIYSEQHRAVKGTAYGVTIMDGDGNERGGFGFTASPLGGGRGVIALDRPTGDAWGAFVDDKSSWVGMTFNYPMSLGDYQPGIEIGVQGERPFLHFKDKSDNTRAEMSIGVEGAASLAIFDAKNRRLADLFSMQH